MVEPEDGRGSIDPRAADDTRRDQAVFDALNHPGPFTRKACVSGWPRVITAPVMGGDERLGECES